MALPTRANSRSVHGMKDDRHPSGLNNYVGYVEIREALKIAPRTVQDLVRAGQFPEPVRLPGRVGGPAVFLASEVNAWDEARQTRRRTHLWSLAVSDPADLAPDKLEGEARRLAATALSKRTGKPVDPSKLSLHLGQRVTSDEFVAAEMKEHEVRAAALADLSAIDAAVIAVALMPSLGPALASTYPDLQELLEKPGGLEVEFKRISDVFRLFDLASRLSERGAKYPLGQGVFEHLAGFEFHRAIVVAASLFPSMRKAYAAEGPEAHRIMFADDAMFEEFVSAALDDTRWPEAAARLSAKAKA